MDSGAYSFLQQSECCKLRYQSQTTTHRVTRAHTHTHTHTRTHTATQEATSLKTKRKSTKKLVNTIEEHIYRMYRTTAAVPVWASSSRPLTNGKDRPSPPGRGAGSNTRHPFTVPDESPSAGLRTRVTRPVPLKRSTAGSIQRKGSLIKEEGGVLSMVMDKGCSI